MKKLIMLIFTGFCSYYFGFSQQNEDLINIHFKQDFEDDTPGIYDYNEYKADWNYPSWEDRYVPPEIIVSNDTNQPSKVLRFIFPNGTVGPYEGGGQWWAPLRKVYKEIYFSYRLKFKPGFEPVLSGKLPGVLGEPVPETNNRPKYEDGFIHMLSWNFFPDLVNYIYHQDQPGQYGQPFALGYGLPTGVWMTITTRIVMNTVSNDRGNNDGILETYIDNKLIHQLENLRFRNFNHIGIDHLVINLHFGG